VDEFRKASKREINSLVVIDAEESYVFSRILGTKSFSFSYGDGGRHSDWKRWTFYSPAAAIYRIKLPAA
jgi:hypothetical protein